MTGNCANVRGEIFEGARHGTLSQHIRILIADVTPGGQEAEGADGEEEVLPVEAAMEDSGQDDREDEEDDDCVEDEPGEKEASLPETETAKGEHVRGQGQRGEDADKDAKLHELESLLVGEICRPLRTEGQDEEGGPDEGVGQVQHGQESDDGDGGSVEFEPFHILPEAGHDTKNFPHGQTGLGQTAFGGRKRWWVQSQIDWR